MNHNSKLLSGINVENLKYSSRIPSAFYYHELAVTDVDYKYNKELLNFFKIIATSVNTTSVRSPRAFRYISIIEAIKYPFYGI